MQKGNKNIAGQLLDVPDFEIRNAFYSDEFHFLFLRVVKAL